MTTLMAMATVIIGIACGTGSVVGNADLIETTPEFEQFWASLDDSGKRIVRKHVDWGLHRCRNRMGCYELVLPRTEDPMLPAKCSKKVKDPR